MFLAFRLDCVKRCFGYIFPTLSFFQEILHIEDLIERSTFRV